MTLLLNSQLGVHKYANLCRRMVHLGDSFIGSGSPAGAF